MARLLLERNRIAADIGRIKEERGMDVADESRESNLRRLVMEACGGAEATVTSPETAGDGADNIRAPAASSPDDPAVTVSRLVNFLLNESLRTQARDGAPTHLSVFHKAGEMARAGADIIRMEVGEPDFMPPGAVRDALTESYDAGHVRYGGPRGMPDLREALAAHATDRYGRGWHDGGGGGDSGAKFTPSDIIVTPGGRFAVFAAMSAILEPGDEVIIPEPAWPAYRDCAMHVGAKVRAVPTALEGSWVPSVSDITDVMSPDTRMIILNYPNNPTGAVLPPDVMDGVMDAAMRRGICVLGDEIYAA